MNASPLRSAVLVFLSSALCGLPAAANDASPWSPPPADACSPEGGLAPSPLGGDAPPELPFRTGQQVGFDALESLRPLLPPAVWEQRTRLFHEGMQLEIGPCFRDYSPPGFFRESTDAFRGRATLTDDGGLADYTAGLPFAPEDIAFDDPQAGLKWAWNFQERYRAGGFQARFRIEDLFGTGRADVFEGEILQVRLSARADLADTGYAVSGSDRQWAAAGKLLAPQDVRDFAWRQYRDAAARAETDRTDELHVWIPALSRARRLPAGELEGLYTPTSKVGVTYKPGEDAAKSGRELPSEIEPRRSGFEILEIRPSLYDFEVLGTHDVLAPINAVRSAFPADAARGFGPLALSWASDRWDLRRALVLEARAREAGEGRRPRMQLWIDLETLHPLYYVAYDRLGVVADVGQFVGRWSEDREKYPRWPGAPDRPVRVIDSAGATFLNLSLGSAWRRESWDAVAVFESDQRAVRDTSLRTLQRGR